MKKIAFAFVALFFATPVSYTHLDVYKRQVITNHFVNRIRQILPNFFRTQETVWIGIFVGKVDFMGIIFDHFFKF